MRPEQLLLRPSLVMMVEARQPQHDRAAATTADRRRRSHVARERRLRVSQVAQARRGGRRLARLR